MRVSIETIVKSVCEVFMVTHEEINSRTRKTEIILPKHAICSLARKYTSLNHYTIGRHVGRKSHSTVIHSIRQFDNLLSTNKMFASRVSEAEARIKAAYELSLNIFLIVEAEINNTQMIIAA